MAGDTVQESSPIVTTQERPVTRTGPRLIAMFVYALLVLTWTLTLGIPNDSVTVFLFLWVGTIAWNIEAPPRYHLNFLRDWWLPVVLLVVYFYSRGLTDELGIPVHWQMPIDVDRAMFGGTIPTETLQAAWCGDPCLRSSEPHWWDLLFTTVYATHFLTGLTLAAVLWMRNRTEWLKWMRRYLAINFAGLICYILYPMAPPWLASEEGYLGPIARITSRGWDDIGLSRIDVILSNVGNPVAAMPSLHAGIAFLVAFYGIERLRSPWRFLLIAYPLAMSTALVYNGEHYVIDVIAGAVLAVAVLFGCRRWEAWRAGKRAAGQADGPAERPAEARSASPGPREHEVLEG